VEHFVSYWLINNLFIKRTINSLYFVT